MSVTIVTGKYILYNINHTVSVTWGIHNMHYQANLTLNRHRQPTASGFNSLAEMIKTIWIFYQPVPQLRCKLQVSKSPWLGFRFTAVRERNRAPHLGPPPSAGERINTDCFERVNKAVPSGSDVCQKSNRGVSADVLCCCFFPPWSSFDEVYIKQWLIRSGWSRGGERWGHTRMIKETVERQNGPYMGRLPLNSSL